MEPLRVRVCVGTNCCVAGGEAILEMLEQDEDLAGLVKVEAIHCLNKACDGGRESPIVEVEGTCIKRATPELVAEEIEKAFLPRIAGSPHGKGEKDA
jgi:NADH:ubiquinone oxidoreductase subunit E